MHLIEMTRLLEDQLNEKALALHLQRVVAGFVGSACRSGQFYQAKVGQARDLGSLHASPSSPASRRHVTLAISLRLASPITRYLGTPMSSGGVRPPIGYGTKRGQPALAMLP